MNKVRKSIAWHAAKLLHSREETQWHRAKWKAARRQIGGRISPRDLPSHEEIEFQLRSITRQLEGDPDQANWHRLKEISLDAMLRWKEFQPLLIGSVASGSVRDGSDINLVLFATNVDRAAERILQEPSESKWIDHPWSSGGAIPLIGRELSTTTRGIVLRLWVVPESARNRPWYDPNRKREVRTQDIGELTQSLQHLDEPQDSDSTELESYTWFCQLLESLEEVPVDLKEHPEGDLLFHSLQVFALASEEFPNDLEALEAALLHDVGALSAAEDWQHASVALLGDSITPRTAWLIEHWPEAWLACENRLGARALRRLNDHPDWDLLLALVAMDQRGRGGNLATPSLEEAIHQLRQLHLQYEGQDDPWES
ncbi:MAG: hypothetical protein ACKN9U_20415 [Pirellulaceae bacterium]